MMSEHENRAFSHPRIVKFHKFFSEYRLWFEVVSERLEVRIRIFETDDRRYFFEQSHFIRTPLYGGPEVRGEAGHETPHLALTTALESITTYYDDAVEAGHEPSLDWFVENHLF